MTQKDEDKNELHDFNEIESEELRAYNRGAVLCNIYEKHVIEGAIPTPSIKYWLEEVSAYLARIPPKEVTGAKEAFQIHLTKRGLM